MSFKKWRPHVVWTNSLSKSNTTKYYTTKHYKQSNKYLLEPWGRHHTLPTTYVKLPQLYNILKTPKEFDYKFPKKKKNNLNNFCLKSINCRSITYTHTHIHLRAVRMDICNMCRRYYKRLCFHIHVRTHLAKSNLQTFGIHEKVAHKANTISSPKRLTSAGTWKTPAAGSGTKPTPSKFIRS